jgi:hypothetical protein
MDLIKKALKEFYQKIYNIENKRFRVVLPNYNENLIKLGKHSGAGSKSLNDLRSVYIRPLKKDFNYQLSVWIDEDETPLGWGELRFEE